MYNRQAQRAILQMNNMLPIYYSLNSYGVEASQDVAQPIFKRFCIVKFLDFF